MEAGAREQDIMTTVLRRRDLRASLLIGLCCLLVYNANRRAISAGDCYPARYLPFAIWQHQTVLLDPIAPIVAQGRGPGQGDTAFWMLPVEGGHTISMYPVVLPVLIAGNRPPDAILAAALGAYGLFWAGRRAVLAGLLAAAAALPIGLVLLYNLGVAGHFAGGYGLVGKAHASFFRQDLLSGLGGLLFSPTRGLFVFSPFLLFLVLVWRHLPQDRSERALTLAMAAGVVLQVLLYAMIDWRAGISWGPRFLTDLLPLLMWMLAPVVASLRGPGRVCFLVAVGVAVAIEAIGAFWYTGATDAEIFAVASGPDQMRAAWDWRNAPFVAPLQDGLAPAELLLGTRGNLDVIQADGRAASEVTAARRSPSSAGRWPAMQGPGRWRSSSTAGRPSPPAPSTTGLTSAAR